MNPISILLIGGAAVGGVLLYQRERTRRLAAEGAAVRNAAVPSTTPGEPEASELAEATPTAPAAPVVDAPSPEQGTPTRPAKESGPRGDGGGTGIAVRGGFHPAGKAAGTQPNGHWADLADELSAGKPPGAPGGPRLV